MEEGEGNYSKLVTFSVFFLKIRYKQNMSENHNDLLYADLHSCMICVARRIIAVERTERFSTRHELSGECL